MTKLIDKNILDTRMIPCLKTVTIDGKLYVDYQSLCDGIDKIPTVSKSEIYNKAIEAYHLALTEERKRQREYPYDVIGQSQIDETADRLKEKQEEERCCEWELYDVDYDTYFSTCGFLFSIPNMCICSEYSFCPYCGNPVKILNK